MGAAADAGDVKGVLEAYEKQSAGMAERWKALPPARWDGTLEFLGKPRAASPMAGAFSSTSSTTFNGLFVHKSERPMPIALDVQEMERVRDAVERMKFFGYPTRYVDPVDAADGPRGRVSGTEILVACPS